jgi:hypothetical protein
MMPNTSSPNHTNFSNIRGFSNEQSMNNFGSMNNAIEKLPLRDNLIMINDGGNFSNQLQMTGNAALNFP